MHQHSQYEVPEGEERETGPEKIFEEVIAEKFPNMGNEAVTQVQEAQSLRQNKPKEVHAETHSKQTDKKLKTERKIKATREKQQIIYKGIHIRLSADFSAETLQARSEWHHIFEVMKGINLQPRILYPVSLSLRFDGETKRFTEKQKLKEFSSTKPALQQMLKELL